MQSYMYHMHAFNLHKDCDLVERKAFFIFKIKQSYNSSYKPWPWFFSLLESEQIKNVLPSAGKEPKATGSF